jgi:hypothetical protein
MTYRHLDMAGTGHLGSKESGRAGDSHKTVVNWWMTAVLVSIGFIMVVTHPVADLLL